MSSDTAGWERQLLATARERLTRGLATRVLGLMGVLGFGIAVGAIIAGAQAAASPAVCGPLVAGGCRPAVAAASKGVAVPAAVGGAVAVLAAVVVDELGGDGSG
jgi:hypothetical protein